MPPKQQKLDAAKQKAKEVAEKKEKEGIDPRTGKLEISKHMTLVLKEYERRCDIRKVFIFPPIKRQFKEAIDEHMALSKIVFYPIGDRKVVLEFQDACKVLLTSKEAQEVLSKERDRAHKELMRTLKKDDTTKAPARLSPLLEALRSKCYTFIETLFVWGFHMDEQESATLAAMLATAKYCFTTIMMLDCLLTSPCLNTIASSFNVVKSLTEVIIDFNTIGDDGCKHLAKVMSSNRTITLLSMRYCNLTSGSAMALNEIVANTPVVNLFLDGNDLGVEGVIPILGPLSDFAKRIAMEGDPREDENATKGKKKKKGKKAKTGSGITLREYPPRLPFLNKLYLTHTGIEHMGLSRKIHSMICFRLMATIVAMSPDIQELDVFGNDIGEIGANMILEALKHRTTNKFPLMGMKIGPKLSSDIVANIIKLAPGQKKKRLGGGGGGKKKK